MIFVCLKAFSSLSGGSWDIVLWQKSTFTVTCLVHKVGVSFILVCLSKFNEAIMLQSYIFGRNWFLSNEWFLWAVLMNISSSGRHSVYSCVIWLQIYCQIWWCIIIIILFLGYKLFRNTLLHFIKCVTFNYCTCFPATKGPKLMKKNIFLLAVTYPSYSEPLDSQIFNPAN